MRTPIPILDPLFEEPLDGSGVTGAIVTLSPWDAELILRDMSFERQRDADPDHIRVLADMFDSGEWAPGSQLTFLIDEDGTPRLVDGQHRLRAAVKAAWQGPWQARVVWGQHHSVPGIYALLDANQKKRPPSVQGRALGFNGLKDRMLGAILLASRYQNEWRSEYSKPTGLKRPPIRDNIDRAKERLDAFVEAEGILDASNVSGPAKRRLYGAQVLAIMVETLACSTDGEAREFWTAVATHSDGVAGELKDGLIERRPPNSGPHYNPRLAAAAWNQRNAAKLKREYRKSLPVEGTTLVIPA